MKLNDAVCFFGIMLMSLALNSIIPKSFDFWQTMGIDAMFFMGFILVIKAMTDKEDW